MPERYLHLLGQILQTFTEQKGPIISGFFAYLFVKAAGLFSITILGESSTIMQFIAAMLEYLLGLASAISVALITVTITHFHKKWLNRKHPIK
jgi:hypothetical protein